MVLRMRVTPDVAKCPSCGYSGLRWSRNHHIEGFEYSARCSRCNWNGLFRELHCDKCSRNWIFVQTSNGWRCHRCGHSQEYSPPIIMDTETVRSDE
jgi:DNA-directed RNA polymerase subunit RPC12/RpoP